MSGILVTGAGTEARDYGLAVQGGTGPLATSVHPHKGRSAEIPRVYPG